MIRYGHVLGLSFLVVAQVMAAPKKELIDVGGKRLQVCRSTEQYIRVRQFLGEVQDSGLNSTQQHQIAEALSANCDGAADRFTSSFQLLKELGVFIPAALKLATKMSAFDSEQVELFRRLLASSYLLETLNMPSQTALDLAMIVAEGSQGRASVAWKDFSGFVSYCLDKKWNLPKTVCAGVGAELIQQSHLFKDGWLSDFRRLQGVLSRKPFGLSVQQRLEMTISILKFGPTSAKNFEAAYNYATKKARPAMDTKTAVAFALSMSEKSLRPDE